ncbi:hypothetical protein, partial [Nocardia abscessus]|uniref:hypothetical protein n=1 Tax=Nocardia abscessus TaxID=120957 RepID=UPI0024579F0D
MPTWLAHCAEFARRRLGRRTAGPSRVARPTPGGGGGGEPRPADQRGGGGPAGGAGRGGGGGG